MGAVRFPGKSLEIIWENYSLLELVLRRVIHSTTLKDVVLATSTNRIDDVLCDLAQSLGVSVFRGPEKDVLTRFIDALEKRPTSAVVRICADNPLVDSEEIDKLVTFFWASQPCDYACNDRLDCGLPDGVGAEVVSLKALRILDQRVKGELREHVTHYITLHPGEFEIARLQAKGKLRRPEIKLDVDTPSDHEAIKRLITRLGSVDAPFWSVNRIIEVYDSIVYEGSKTDFID